MAFFAAVVVSNLIQIACCSAQIILVLIIIFFLVGLTRLGCVDFASRCKAFMTSSVLLLLSTMIFLLLPSLSRRLRVIGAASCFRGPGLKFFFLGVFSQLALSTGLGRSRVSWLRPLKTVLIHVLDGNPRP